MLAAPPIPVLFTTRAEATVLVLLPLNKLLASTPFSRNVLLVSRWPLAQIGWFPRPAFTPVPLGSSALIPGDRIARPVKLPVGSGTASIFTLSSTYPLVVSTVLISGVSSTVTVVLTAHTLRVAFTVKVLFACTVIEGIFWVSNEECVNVSV